MAEKGSPGKHWCFTNNQTEFTPKWDPDFMTYLVYGDEIAPTTGQSHHQGFVSFNRKMRMKQVKKCLGINGIYCDKVRNMNAMIEYCRKEGSIHEFGVRPKAKGHRSDLAAACELARTEGIVAVAEQHASSFVRYHKGFTAYLGALQPKRTWKTDVIWMWGPSGIGKSRKAMEIAGENAYWKPMGTKWWDGYEGQEVVVIDDYVIYSKEAIGLLCAWMDAYPTRIETKGGSVQLLARLIIITCVAHPESLCWDGRWPEVRRRITATWNVGDNFIQFH